MKKGSIFLIIILIITTFLIGCTNSEVVDSNTEPQGNETVNENDNSDNENDNSDNDSDIDNENKNENEEDSDIVVIVPEGIKSPLSGLYGPEEKVNRRPIAIMFDNFKTARWQAGLSQAEIVYEILAEGKITRYMGLFLMNDPNLIGPVRSSRPYFITKALEYNAVYAHCGGSEQAYKDIKNLGIANLDEIRNSGFAFFRYYDTGKKNEHTLYTTMEKLRDAQKKLNYKENVEYESFVFSVENKDIEGNVAKELLIEYFSNNTTKYIFDEENKVYKRYKDGEIHIDEYDGKVLTAKNIIIQKADTKVIDSYGRRNIDLMGEGEGIFITNGKSIEVTWKKESRKDKTRFYDKDNNEITLNSGITWVQVIEKNTKITIK